MTEGFSHPQALLPRASLQDVLRGRAKLVGPRCSADAPRGVVSPIEARVHLGLMYGDLAQAEAEYFQHRTLRSDAGVVLRAILAQLVSSDGRTPESRPYIVSAHVDNLTIQEALRAILSEPSGERARMIHIVHPHALNLAIFNLEYSIRLGRADLVLPDGFGIRLAARILGVTLRANVNGTDLLPLLCQTAAEKGVALGLIGGAPGIARTCADKLIESFPGLKIPLVEHGFLDVGASDEVAARVRALGRCVVLVGMGSPRQEAWAQQYLSNAAQACVLTVGGLFDFYSGRIPRAPWVWRELGMEWLFRLYQEPRRLARRYLLGNPLFLAMALRQRVNHALGRRP